jgi:uncharacterized membrane protein YdbT with pleckstrin-like domain
MHRMRYVDRNLTAGETVLYETRLHWIVMLRSIVQAVIAFALAVGLLYYALSATGVPDDQLHLMEGGAAVLAVLGIILLFAGSTRRNATEMAVTNHRVIIKVGLVGRRTVELLLSKIESIEVQETAVGRMLGYGTIVLIGTGGTPEPFDRVAHPLEFRSMVQQQIEALPQGVPSTTQNVRRTI